MCMSIIIIIIIIIVNNVISSNITILSTRLAGAGPSQSWWSPARGRRLHGLCCSILLVMCLVLFVLGLYRFIKFMYVCVIT